MQIDALHLASYACFDYAADSMPIKPHKVQRQMLTVAFDPPIPTVLVLPRSCSTSVCAELPSGKIHYMAVQ
jgi:hypothetical protein